MKDLTQLLAVALIAVGLLTACTSTPCTADLVITGGYVIDGTGEKGYYADILVQGDRIQSIEKPGKYNCPDADIIDASGLVVTPGFIDVHAHGDPLATPDFENFLAMGVTTIMLGQDGSSPWIRDLDERINGDSIRCGVNVGYLAGHGTLRRGSGVGHEPADAREIERLAELVEDAMTVGCFGISTGLEYVPGSFAQPDELEELARAVGAYNGMIMSHMRSEDDDIIDQSLNELIAQGEYCRVHAAHLKSVFGKGGERGKAIIGIIENAQARGVEITADMYPYLASYTGIAIVFPPWAKTTEDFEYAKVSREAELRRYLYERVMSRNGPEATLFGGPPFTGMTLEEVADSSDRSFVDVLMSMGPESISAAYFIMDEDLQHGMFVNPYVMVGSDGSPTMHHPRGHGTFARVLRHYVSELGLLTLEEAVRKMTGLSAGTIRLNERGFIREGYYADITIMDTINVWDKATFAEPHVFAEGFEYVLVNGKVARTSEGENVERHGKVLSAEKQP